MQNPPVSWKFFLIYSLFVAIIAILIVGGMIYSPSAPASRIFLGLSLPRLVLAIGLFTAFILFVVLAIKAFSNHRWAESASEHWFGKSHLGRGISWFAGIGFGLGWIGCFLPFYRAGPLAIPWERI